MSKKAGVFLKEKIHKMRRKVTGVKSYLVILNLNIVEKRGDDLVHVLRVPDVLCQVFVHYFPHHSSQALKENRNKG
jgi:hypothetical protein